MSSINARDEPAGGRFSGAKRAGEILAWREVAQIHRTRHGIYQRGGRLVSLLTDFGRINPCYPDALGENENTILYTGAGRRGDQRLDPPNRAMLDAVESGHGVPLFNKLAVGRWQFWGCWRVGGGKYVFDAGQDRMVWVFTLRKVVDEKENY